MGKLNAVITGVGGYVPDYILTNAELSRMVDTSDEWIRTRVGILERRILKEEGLGASYLARKACKQLLKKTGTDPDSIDALIVSTTTPDYPFPSTASIVLGTLGCKLRLLWLYLRARYGFGFDTVGAIQEDYCLLGRENVVSCRLDRPSNLCSFW